MGPDRPRKLRLFPLGVISMVLLAVSLAYGTVYGGKMPPVPDEPALQITCANCDEETFIPLMRLRMLAFLRCGCGHMLLDEDEVRDYRQRLERSSPD